MEKMYMSPRGSFKGYSFFVAVKRNKEAIKTYLSIIGAVNIIPPFDERTFLITMAGGLIALAVKLVQDAVDYYSTDVEVTVEIPAGNVGAPPASKPPT